MDVNRKYYIALITFAIGALLVTYSSTAIGLPGQSTSDQITALVELIIGIVLTIGGGISFYYYREQRKHVNSPEEMEINAMIKAQEYKDSQKKN